MKRHDWIRLVGWQQRQRQQRKKAKKIKVSDVIVFYGTKSGETNGSGRNNEPNSYYTWNVFEENYTKLNNNEKKSDLTRLEFGRFCENNTHTHTHSQRDRNRNSELLLYHSMSVRIALLFHHDQTDEICRRETQYKR